MKITLIIIVTLILAAWLYSVFKSNREASSDFSKDILYGPFTIKVTASTSKGYNMNSGVVHNTSVAYNIFHEGKPVTFPGALQNNTGLPFLWAVYSLPDAPDPTLVAGSQSMYLIYLKNGIPIVEPLLTQGHDFASLQFLDSDNGQPGLYSEVYMKNEAVNLDQLDSLKGGRYLMVSEHAVLDVLTRKVIVMNKDNNPVDNYSFPSPHGALAFSPDQKSIVFHSEFQSWNTQVEDLPDSEHALVVYNFESDRGYAVKYDDTDTRMTDVFDINYKWFTQYFEWDKQPEGDRLHLRQLEKLPNWTGKYNPKDNYYTIYPVKPGMLSVFLDFVLKQMNWSKENILEDKTGEYTGHTLTLGSGEMKLDIGFKEDEQKLTFSNYLYGAKTTESEALVKKIADTFNTELLEGKHQEQFGRILSSTKQIMGGYDKKK
jgi:hypothetical protein